MLTDSLAGKSLEDAVALDGVVTALLDEQSPTLPRDCAVGPEDVIRQGARQNLDRHPESLLPIETVPGDRSR